MTDCDVPPDPITIHGQAEDGAIVAIDVVVGGDSLESGIRDLILGEWWPPIGLAAVDQPEVDIDLTLSVDPSMPASLIRMESDLSLWAASHLANLVAVHAAVFADGDSIVVLPGPSFAGKSTLSLAAMDLGLEVLSDEYALIDPATGRIRGWPRPVRRRGPNGVVDRFPIPMRQGSVMPSMVAMINYDASLAGDTGLEVEPMSQGETVTALLANTVCAQSRPSDSFTAAVAVARLVNGVRGTRGEAAMAIAEIRMMLADRPADDFD